MHNSEVSEKAIERYLSKLTQEAGGLSLKYSNATQTGYPDRILMFPNGHQIWVEVKGRGEVPTLKQIQRIKELRRVGQIATVCDSRQTAERIVKLMSLTPLLARCEWGKVGRAEPEARSKGEPQIFWR